jgi:hypothetical protein
MAITLIYNYITLISIAGHFWVIYLIHPLRRGLFFSIALLILYTSAIFTPSIILQIKVTVLFDLIRGLFYIPLLIFMFRGQASQKVFALTMNYVTVSFFAALTSEIARYIAPVDSLKYIIICAVIYSLLLASYNVLVFLFFC